MATIRKAARPTRPAVASAPLTAAAATAPVDHSSAILDDLMGKAHEAVTAVESRERQAIDLATELTKLGEQIDTETAQLVREGDIDRLKELMQRARQRILNATLEELRADFAQEEGDLAEALAALQATLGALDQQFEQLDEPPAEAREIIAEAEAAVREAEQEIEEAKQAWFRRATKTAAAEIDLKTAKMRLEEAHRTAQLMARERVRSANFEQSFQRIQLMATRIADVIQQGFRETDTRLKITAERRQAALELKEQAARALEKVRTGHAEAEDKLRAAQDQLQGLVNGTPEYVQQEQVIADLRAHVEDLAGRCSTALGVLQSKERFVVQHELFEKALQKLRSNLRTMEAILRSDTEERIHTFAARLQTQKAGQQQEGGLVITRLGREQDSRNLEAGAAVAAQSERAMATLAESQKEHMARLAATVAGFEEAHAQVRARMIQLYKETAARYGLDVREEQYLTYTDQGPAAAGVTSNR